MGVLWRQNKLKQQQQPDASTIGYAPSTTTKSSPPPYSSTFAEAPGDSRAFEAGSEERYEMQNFEIYHELPSQRYSMAGPPEEGPSDIISPMSRDRGQGSIGTVSTVSPLEHEHPRKHGTA